MLGWKMDRTASASWRVQLAAGGEDGSVWRSAVERLLTSAASGRVCVCVCVCVCVEQ